MKATFEIRDSEWRKILQMKTEPQKADAAGTETETASWDELDPVWRETE